MEIDRRSFCKLLILSSASLLAGCFQHPYPDKSVTFYENRFPGKVIPLDRNAIRKIGKWAG